MKRTLIAVLLIAALAYGADFTILRLRSNSTGTITVHRSYVIPLKNGRNEYTSDEVVDQPCVHSLLPHLGDTPCWYLARHTQQQITIDTGSKKEYPH
jgi:hypothetical protein